MSLSATVVAIQKTRPAVRAIGREIIDRLAKRPTASLLKAMRSVRLLAAADPAQIKRDEQGRFAESGNALANAPLREVRGSDRANEAAQAFIDKPLTHLDTGLIATVSQTSLTKLVNGTAVNRSHDAQAHLHAVANLDHLFPHALHRESRPGKKSTDQDIQAIHHFEVPVPYAGDIFRAHITVKEFKNKAHGNRIYLVRALQIKKPASYEEAPVSSKAQPVPASPAGFEEKFDALAAAVKTAMQKRGSVQASRGGPRPQLLAALKAARLLRTTLKPVRIQACRFRDRTGSVRLKAAGKSLVKRFSGVAYSGGVMHPSVTIDGVTQAMDVILDLDTLIIPDQVRPVLDDHDESTDGLIGQTALVARRGRELHISGKLYGWKLRAKQILAAARAGHVWQLSVGTDGFTLDNVAAGQTVAVNGQTFRGPVKVARGAYLTDFSFVAVGADDRTSAVIAAGRDRRGWISGCGTP